MSARTRNRGVVWLTAFAAALSLAVAIAGFKVWVPREFTYFGLALFLCCLVVIGMVVAVAAVGALFTAAGAALGAAVNALTSRGEVEEDVHQAP